MKYILLEISHRTIALFYNGGDGARTMQPFREGRTLPLALCYMGGEYHTGVFAQQQKDLGHPEAYDNLFQEARKNSRCHDILSKDYVPTVVNLSVSQICREQFLIDAKNKASEITIILLYSMDVKEEERKMLNDALLPYGYASVIVADRAQRTSLTFLKYKNEELKRNKAALVINSDNEDLSVKCLSLTDGCTIVEKHLLGKGKDPRFQYGINQIWLGVENQVYSTKDKELPYLERALRNFIANSQVEMTSVELSDGTYSTYLSKTQYNNYSSHDTSITTDFVSILSQGKVSPSDCFVILENYATGNKFFKDALIQFSPIIDEDKAAKKEMRDLLIQDIIDGRPISFYNISTILEQEKQRLIEVELKRQADARAAEEAAEQERLKTQTPTVFIEEKPDNGPGIQAYDGARKFTIKSSVVKSGGFFSRRTNISIEVSVDGDKPLPCNCALTIDTQNYKTYREETKFEEMDKGDKGPFQFGPYTMPLSGIEKGAKVIYAHVYPTDRTFPMNLFRNNHIEIKL